MAPGPRHDAHCRRCTETSAKSSICHDSWVFGPSYVALELYVDPDALRALDDEIALGLAEVHHILSGLGVPSFASINSDVACLIARDPGWGLTDEDLAPPRFQYLRPIV